MTDRSPQERSRASDTKPIKHALILARRWAGGSDWYRDVWLFVVSGIVLWAVIIGSDNTKTIQNQRIATTYRNCSDQNKRHDKTIASLKKESKEEGGKQGVSNLVELFDTIGLKVTHREEIVLAKFELLQAQESVASTSQLIDDLAPHQNCSEAVSAAIGKTKSKPKAQSHARGS